MARRRLRCCRPCCCVERWAHRVPLVFSWAFWVLPLRGPCWTRNAQERIVSGVWGAQGCGVLTWECAGNLASGNISFFWPPGWDRAAFFCACVCRGSGWPGRASGGVSKVPYQGAPFPGTRNERWTQQVPGGVVSDDGVGFPRFTRRWDPGSCPTKGPASLYSGPTVGTDDGAGWSEWSPTKGPAAGGGEHSRMMGHAARMRSEAPDSPAGH